MYLSSHYDNIDVLASDPANTAVEIKVELGWHLASSVLIPLVSNIIIALLAFEHNWSSICGSVSNMVIPLDA